MSKELEHEELIKTRQRLQGALENVTHFRNWGERQAKRIVELEEAIEKLQADNARLREALTIAVAYVEGVYGSNTYFHKADLQKMEDALAATPEQSLQALKDEVIEKVAMMFEALEGINCLRAMQIRALKGKL